jgi:hypothetical protein
MSDTKAADIVRDYLASVATKFPHVSVESVKASTESGGRSLSLELRSDGSDEANLELYGLCTDSAAPGGWADRLNQGQGLGLTRLHIVVNYPTGKPDSMLVDLVGHTLSSPGGAPRFRGGPPTAAPTTS